MKRRYEIKSGPSLQTFYEAIASDRDPEKRDPITIIITADNWDTKVILAQVVSLIFKSRDNRDVILVTLRGRESMEYNHIKHTGLIFLQNSI